MVLFLGFAAAMIGMMLVAFNSGQVTNAKMRAMNAADAAAYSGAVWQARNLNFQAYMNRAMVVNEVTIAQSVSLRSWVGYLDKLVSNINMIAKFVPPSRLRSMRSNR
ncbi:pilus assembly protein TadG-related protein [Duganella sp. P38]|uniref:pilus assembly protein TadG-related protein n=1 Tax=Duganella sp. P38 TaxID=3423949 RepID=UPI003D7BEE40